MARLFSNDELALVDNWATKAKQERNFNDADSVGKEMLRLCEGYNPINETALEAIAAAMQAKGWAVFRSNDEMAYNAAYDALPQSGKDAFAAWWGRQGSAVDKSAKAATLLINWCAGRGVSQSNLDLAMGNLASRGLLTVRQPSNYRGGIHSGKDLRDEVPLSERTDALGNRLHPSREPSPAAKAWAEKESRDAAKGNPSAASDAAWKEKWENLQGNNYPQTAKVRAILINNPDGSPNYRAMYESGLLLLDESGKQPFRR